MSFAHFLGPSLQTFSAAVRAPPALLQAKAGPTGTRPVGKLCAIFSDTSDFLAGQENHGK